MSPKEAAAMEELGIVPQASDVFGGKSLKRFINMVDERESLKEMEEGAKKERGYSDHGKRVVGIDDGIKNMLADLKKVILPDGRSVQMVERQGNEYVDIKLLLQEGVPADVINKCKRRGASSWFILVGKVSEVREAKS